MLDHLRLAIPVHQIYAVERGEGCFYFEGDLLTLGLHCSARFVRLDDEGIAKHYDIYTPYDTLGTDFSDMAVKFYDKARHTLPYLELKASPAKLLQGHNVYGSDDIEQGALEMLGLVAEAFPNLCQYLDFDKTEVLHLDCTYSIALPSQKLVKPVLEYLSNASKGHAKSQNIHYENYTRWGSQNSRYIGRKAYGKFDEVQQQIKKLKKEQGKQAINKLNALQNALPFANAKVRFEARIHKTYLTKNNYPSNLLTLINLQRQNPTLLQELWQIAFNPVFETLKGKSMQLQNDDYVYDMLKSKLFTITKAGNISYAKAEKAYQFYKVIKSDGYVNVKKRMARPTFYRNVGNLIEVGISKAWLQNLHLEKPKIIPFNRLVEMDFSHQLPDNFVAPISKYYLQQPQHLRSVA